MRYNRYWTILFVQAVLPLVFGYKSQPNTEIKSQISKEMEPKIIKTDAEWKAELTREQFHILREKGTEYPGTGEYYLNFEKGTYVCAACGMPLFESGNKFESSCG